MLSCLKSSSLTVDDWSRLKGLLEDSRGYVDRLGVHYSKSSESCLNLDQICLQMIQDWFNGAFKDLSREGSMTISRTVVELKRLHDEGEKELAQSSYLYSITARVGALFKRIHHGSSPIERVEAIVSDVEETIIGTTQVGANVFGVVYRLAESRSLKRFDRKQREMSFVSKMIVPPFVFFRERMLIAEQNRFIAELGALRKEALEFLRQNRNPSAEELARHLVEFMGNNIIFNYGF